MKMRIKWQWFLGGRIMFYVSIILFFILVISFITTYVVDITALFETKPQALDPTTIQEISEKYVEDLRNRDR